MRTYAPCGETPELRYRYWDHLSVISAITPDGKLYTMTQEESFKAPNIVRFLKHLLRHVPGKLLVVWDRLPAHRSNAVKDFLREGGTRRIHLAQLPSYAPDLNPDEGVWNYLKRVELKNVCCHNRNRSGGGQKLSFYPPIAVWLGSRDGACLSQLAASQASVR